MLSQVMGQDEGVAFLQRVVDEKLTSPLLLVGPEGVGKRLAVLEAAKDYFTKDDHTDTYHSRQIDLGEHPDLKIVCGEGDSGIKVDAIRDLIRSVNTYPSYAPARFIVIEGADRMNSAAANALLKTLEEPPKIVRFFLLAESLNGVLPTIQSRCGLVRFRPLPEAFILARIQRDERDPAKALVLTRLAEGSVGRAIGYWASGRLRLRDQVLELLKPDLLQNPDSLFAAVNAIGADHLALGLCFLEHVLHDLLMISVDPSRITNVDITDQISALSRVLGPEKISRASRGIRAVQKHLARRVEINLPIHVKSALLGVGS
jgi:DNA polymerase-3 subunit delta'